MPYHPIEDSRVPVALVALDAAAFDYDQLYSYRIPDALVPLTKPGMRAAVPFGMGNRRRIGMILSIGTEDRNELRGRKYALKQISAVLDREPVLTEELHQLAEWLHEHTFCTWYDAVRAVLPGGMQLRLEQHYALLERPAGAELTEFEENLYDHLRAAEGKERDELIRHFEGSGKKKLLDALVQKGCLAEISEGKQRVSDSVQQLVRLSPDYLTSKMCFSPTKKQLLAVHALEEHTALTVKECAYYAGVTEAVVRNLIKAGIAELYESEYLCVPRDAEVTAPPEKTVLTPQQQAAYDAVAEAICAEKAAAFLLYGVTGSGKTAVFEQLIALTLRQDRQVLLLIPEISLTPQVVQYFRSRFGNQVALIHSGLSLRQRRDTDTLIRRGEIRIVIGTRSAVFAPLPNIGLLILDEEGEHSYKSEQSPRYHAAEVARERCRRHNAALVLASATPSLESRYLAERGVYTLLRMPERYNQAPLPEVTVVDMNEERLNGNGSAFSAALTNALQENLECGEQSILLLNRRGYHTLMQCQNCREPLYCPNCSVPMTYHKANDSLMCHFCGHVQPPTDTCPKCGQRGMRQMGFGTQRLEEELQSLLPDARILRMDADTTMSRTAYDTGFRAFANGEYDILCGTQMIGKGLDFPNVTLVGVVSVDKALIAGDFRSYERTFSLVTQVVGRGGRGKRPGRAILQTYMPDHYVLQLAAAQDYDSFYAQEIAMRRALLFPPVCDICVIGFAGLVEDRVKAAADRFVQILAETLKKENLRLPLRVLGPAEANYSKVNNRYRMRVLLKCKDTEEMRHFIRSLMAQTYQEKVFGGIAVYADMNGDCGI